MRILAVRGRNLRSLEGDFEVALDSGPLGAAGLFAITGPTGAGKSTLLDAICLALFNCVPRITEGKSTVQIADGTGTIGAADTRTALRRHAAEGFAEVDFVGLERRRYRARWSVRRARGRADGTLQGVAMSLGALGEGDEITEDLTPGGIKATLEAIEGRLGLTFEQFKRAALLAQGDFAAFLHAKADERAVLLERLTGKTVYTAISRRAYERWKEEEAALAALVTELQLHASLEPAERAATEALVAALTAQLAALRGRSESARKAADWYAGADSRASAVEAARAGEAEALAAWTGGDGRRAELAAVDAAQRHRAVVARLDDRASAAAEARRQLDALSARRLAADGALAETVEAHAKAAARCAEAEARSEAAKPELARALLLDNRIEEAARQAKAAAAAVVEAERALAIAGGEARRLDSHVVALRTRRGEATSWLETHAQTKALAEEWPRWRHELERYAAATGRRTEAEERRAALADAHEQRLSEAKDTEKALGAAAGAHEDAKSAIAKAKLAAAELPPGPLRERRDQLVRVVSTLRDLWREASEAGPRAMERAAQRERAGSARQEAEAARTQRSEAEERRGQLEATLGEAERAAQAARDARDMEAHRADLRDGEPCPLCGSEDHPWADGSPLARLVGDQEARVRSLQNELRQALEAGAGAASRASSFEKDASEAERRVLELDSELKRREATWGELRATLDEPAIPGELLADGAAEALKTIGTARSQQQKEVDAQVREAEAREQAVALAQQALDRLRSAWDEATAAHQAAERAVVDAHRQLGEAEAAVTQADREREAATEALAGAFSGRDGWVDALRRDPPAFIGRCAEEVAEWQERVKAQAAAGEELTTAEPQRARAQTEAEAAEKEAGRARKLRDDQQTALDALRGERAGVLGGRPREEAEAELRDAIEQARRALDAAVEARDGAKERVAALATQAESTEQQLGRLSTDCDEARAQVDDALTGLGIDLAALRERLAWDEPRIASRRAELDALRQQLDQARTVREVKEQEQRQHAESGPPSMPREEATAALEEAAKSEEAINVRLVAARVVLEKDDEHKARAAELRDDVEAQQVARNLWKTMADLVGSADGKKLRVFAQSLTMTVLLQEANARLRDIHRRYELQRVPGTDLELQVLDHDMGGEPRAVSSLSGGETFLVSLALALGLSSLAVRDTRIESLFVDEGFGSLDPETLEQALAALDALQATGCQVGLISHVQGMAERIGAQVKVTPVGSGRSVVRIEGPGHVGARPHPLAASPSAP